MRKLSLIVLLSALVALLAYRGYQAVEQRRQLEPEIAYARKMLSIPVQEDNAGFPLAVAMQPYRQMLLNGDYAALESAHDRLMESREALADGRLMLEAYYAGITTCWLINCPDKQAPEQDWTQMRDALDQWSANGSPLGQLARASFQMSYAWRIRGTKLAPRTPRDQLESFQQLIVEAEGMFAELPVQSQDYLLYPNTLINLSKAGKRWTHADGIAAFEKARAANPWYFPLYPARGALSTEKWGGAEGEHAAYLEQEIARSVDETLTATLYARLSIANETLLDREQMQTNWIRFQASLKRFTETYPDQWNINQYAYYTCFVGDPEPLLGLLERIDLVIVPVWRKLEYFHACRDHMLKKRVSAEAIAIANEQIAKEES